MGVNTYSLAVDGDKQLSSNLKVREFACKDGSDYILISDQLVTNLQRLRDRIGKPLNITSAYRNPSHNSAVGGASNSQHLKGTAADIYFSGVPPLEVAKLAEYIGFTGIGWYNTFTHVDVRSGKYFWDNRTTTLKTVNTFLTSDDKFEEEPDVTEKLYNSLDEIEKHANWAYPAVKWQIENEITQGTTDGNLSLSYVDLKSIVREYRIHNLIMKQVVTK